MHPTNHRHSNVRMPAAAAVCASAAMVAAMAGTPAETKIEAAAAHLSPPPATTTNSAVSALKAASLQAPASATNSVPVVRDAVPHQPPATGSSPNIVSATRDVAAAPLTEVPDEIQPGLRDTQSWLKTTNLTQQMATKTRGQVQDFRLQLDMARQQRVAKNFTQADSILTMLLQADAPEDIQRTALLELALSAQQQGFLTKAQQIFAQYVRRYPEDPSVPEILLRQGLLYRQAGATTLALAKFYSVMTVALNLKLDRLEYYQRLVLQAQTEIADTYYLQGKFSDAADFFSRLLLQDTYDLNKALIHFKLVHSYSQLNRHTDVVVAARQFLAKYPEDSNAAEARFSLAHSLKQLNHRAEALEEVLKLLQSQQKNAEKDPKNWRYWQQRAGNELANQFYSEGDYVNALQLYLHLLDVDTSVAWQLPVRYQIGLIYERLQQPQKALESYAKIISQGKSITQADSPALSVVVDMAKYRQDYLTWYNTAQRESELLRLSAPAEK